MESLDRRQWVRVKPCRMPQASVGESGGVQVQVLNLSPTGAMIEHPTRLSPGETCTLSVLLAGSDFHIRARVAWSQVYSTARTLPGKGQLRFRSGLSFLPHPGGAEAHLRQYLAALTSPNSELFPALE